MEQSAYLKGITMLAHPVKKSAVLHGTQRFIIVPQEPGTCSYP
jgi:hypothetical protein